ncbi:Gfo/Idh/MocA family oxidoreductase [Bacillus carboniphilus]|uniref:Gfo/Idh/MocA family oxidoreductase n=1 Tax=Bacillus carboniphilus TaxID=86663 RepID=A0ABN0W8D4_9BACI
MTIRFGLIGCGYISRKHIQALSNCEEAQLVALSDLLEVRMEESKQFYQDNSGKTHPMKGYKNYEEMLSNQEIDAIIITSISGLHAQMAKAALLSNKHVILEKPMALSIEESNELIQLAKQKEKVLMVCHQLRFRPLMQKIKKVVDEGKIGKPYLGVVSIRINRSQDYYSAASWRGKWNSDGGMLINQGIHLVDLLQWFLGDVKTVYGEICENASAQKETEDIALGILNFQNNAKGIVEANIITQPDNLGYSLSIFGEKGTISLKGGPTLNTISRWYIEGENTSLEELIKLADDGNEQIYMYQNFMEAINSDTQNLLISGEEGKKALETIFAIYQSDLTKQVIQLPLSSFSTVNLIRKEGETQ